MATIEMSKMKVGSNVVEIVDQKARNDIKQLNVNKDDLYRVKADSIKCTFEGETIIATDSAEAKFEGLRVFGKSTQASTTGKNLLKNTTVSSFDSGVTFTVNKDGSIATNGTGGSNVFHTLSPITLSAGDYIINGCPKGSQYQSGNWTYAIYIIIDGIYYWDSGEGVQFTLTETKTITLRIRILEGINASNLVFKPMVRLASITDDTFEPYTGGQQSPNPEYPQPIESIGDDGSVDVGVYGGNIVNSKKIVKNRNESVNVSDDGYTITVVGGTTTNWSDSYIDIVEFPKLKGKKLYVSIDSVSATNVKATKVSFIVVATTKKTNYSLQDGKKEVVIPYDAKDVYVSISTNYSEDPLSSQNEVVVKGLMVSLSDIPYEPYKKTQTLVSTVGDGLCGIPLGATIPDAIASSEKHMRGVWWCEEDQQYYIGDTKEYGRGKNVQRIGELVLDDSTKGHYMVGSDVNYSDVYGQNFAYIQAKDRLIIDSCCMSTVGLSKLYGKYEGIYPSPENHSISLTLSDDKTGITSADDVSGRVNKINAWLQENPVTVSYVLAEPIETDLPSSEIEAFKALHSNYPTTTILNDCNAFTEVTMVADTKNHIEQNYVPKSEFESVLDRLSAVEQALA